MSILSQVGIVVLIVFIVFVIVKANKNVDKAAEQEEHFSDTWEQHQEEKSETTDDPAPESADIDIVPEEVETEETPQEGEPETENVVPVLEHGHFCTLIRLDEYHTPLERIDVNDLPFTIGRAGENSLILEDLSVSRRHCKIVKKENQLILQDLGTQNKILVGGTRACESLVLQDQIRFYIGNEEFLVELS